MRLARTPDLDRAKITSQVTGSFVRSKPIPTLILEMIGTATYSRFPFVAIRSNSPFANCYHFATSLPRTRNNQDQQLRVETTARCCSWTFLVVPGCPPLIIRNQQVRGSIPRVGSISRASWRSPLPIPTVVGLVACTSSLARQAKSGHLAGRAVRARRDSAASLRPLAECSAEGP